MNGTTNVKDSGIGIVIASVLVASGCGTGGGPKGPVASVADVGSTVVAGSLVEARAGHQATELRDGTVLVTGGRTHGALATSTAERIDPATGLSQPLPDGMSAPRAGHRALLLSTGAVWLVGGHDASGRPLRSTEVFSPADGSFRPGPELRAPRDGAAVVVTDDHFVLLGGRGEASIELWTRDLSRGTTLGLALPGGPRSGGSAVEVQDGVLFLGGGIGPDGRPARPVWIELAQGRATEEPGAFVEGGAVARLEAQGEPAGTFVVGGRFEDDPLLELQEVAFERRGQAPRFSRLSLLHAREGAAVASTPQGLLVAGGAVNGLPTASVEVLHPRHGTSEAPSLHVARREPVATVLASGAVLFSGGVGADGRPVLLTELLVPQGARGPDGQAAFERARAERDAALARAAELRRTQAELARVEAALAAANGRVEDLEAELRATRDELQAERDRSARLEAELTQARAELERRRAEVERLAAQVAALTAQVSERDERLRDAQAQLGRARADLESSDRRAGQLASDLASTRSRLAQAESTADGLRAQLAGERDRAAQLAAERARLATAAAVPAPAPAPAAPAAAATPPPAPLPPGTIGVVTRLQPGQQGALPSGFSGHAATVDLSGRPGPVLTYPPRRGR